MDEFKIVSNRKIFKDMDSCCSDRSLMNLADKYAQILTGKPKVIDQVLPRAFSKLKPKRKRGCY